MALKRADGIINCDMYWGFVGMIYGQYTFHMHVSVIMPPLRPPASRVCVLCVAKGV